MPNREMSERISFCGMLFMNILYMILTISAYLQEWEPEGISSFGSLSFSSLYRLQKEADVVGFSAIILMILQYSLPRFHSVDGKIADLAKLNTCICDTVAVAVKWWCISIQVNTGTGTTLNKRNKISNKSKMNQMPEEWQ